MLITQKNSIVKKIELALNNFISYYEAEQLKFAIQLHTQLSSRKILFFIPRHRNLPNADIKNLPALMDLSKSLPTKELLRLQKIGLHIFTLLRMAKKSERMPQFKFLLLNDEVEMINEWADRSKD